MTIADVKQIDRTTRDAIMTVKHTTISPKATKSDLVALQSV